MAYRAPEIYLGYPATGALDIWVIGCMVSPSSQSRRSACRAESYVSPSRQQAFWLISGGHVFVPPFFGGGRPGDEGWSAEEEQLGEMLERLSSTQFPLEMRENSRYWGKYLDERGGCCARAAQTRREPVLTAITILTSQVKRYGTAAIQNPGAWKG